MDFGLCMIRSIQYRTSSIVMTVPSQNFTPWRILKTYVLGSGCVHDSARYGRMTPLASYTTRPWAELEIAASEQRSPAFMGSRSCAAPLNDQVTVSSASADLPDSPANA